MNGRNTKSSSKGRWRLPIHVYLAYLLVCTFLLTGVSFSRYITTANGDDSARVAAGGITVTGESGNTELILSSGGETVSYKFDVSNTANGTTSEVAIRYDVVVTLKNALPNGVTMRLDGKEGSNDGENTYTFSDVGTFAAGVSATQGHTLSFVGDYDKISTTADGTYEIQITIRSQQID